MPTRLTRIALLPALLLLAAGHVGAAAAADASQAAVEAQAEAPDCAPLESFGLAAEELVLLEQLAGPAFPALQVEAASLISDTAPEGSVCVAAELLAAPEAAPAAPAPAPAPAQQAPEAAEAPAAAPVEAAAAPEPAVQPRALSTESTAANEPVRSAAPTQEGEEEVIEIAPVEEEEEVIPESDIAEEEDFEDDFEFEDTSDPATEEGDVLAETGLPLGVSTLFGMLLVAGGFGLRRYAE